jgi:hypothetical protein
MADGLSPEDRRRQTVSDEAIEAVLAEVVEAGAMCHVAMAINEDAEVVDRWSKMAYAAVERLETCRDEDDEGSYNDQARAILILLNDRMQAKAKVLLKDMWSEMEER